MMIKDPVSITAPAPARSRTRFSPASILSGPARDFLSAMENAMKEAPAVNTGIMLLCLLLSWWVYVPVHELLHVLGCVISGGSVSRLDLSPVYGAVFLQKFFPFISAGSEYAGQLKGFDTSGSDITYLVTVFLPYTLTVGLGVPLLQMASSGKASSRSNSIRFGIAVPLAYAPFIGLTGDYYEMASIVISRLTAWTFPGFNPLYWRSDDLLKLSRQLIFTGHAPALRDIAGLAASFLLAVILAFCTYAAGTLCAKMHHNYYRKESRK